jgi:hypothetical protein
MAAARSRPTRSASRFVSLTDSVVASALAQSFSARAHGMVYTTETQARN